MKPLSSRIRAKSIVQLAIVMIFLLPILWMILAALRPPGSALPKTLEIIPRAIDVGNFRRVFDLAPFGRFAVNSLLVVALAVPLTLLISSWAGFGMARLPRNDQRRWLVISLAALMVPGMALWSSRFVIFRQLGLLDSIWALIAPAWMGTSPFFILMFYRAFRRVPAGIYDAARIDGAGVLRTWSQVALPIA
jgi:multiple sugar transport system permease protein